MGSCAVAYLTIGAKLKTISFGLILLIWNKATYLTIS